MKRLLVSAAVLGLVTASGAYAAPTATDSVDATVTIVNTLTVTGDTAMSFGQLSSPANGNVVVSVASNGTLTSSPALEVPTGSTGSPAIFTVNGTDGLQFTADLNGSSSALTGGGGADMPLSLAIVGGGTNLTTSGGSKQITVTGDLTVNQDQTAGIYTGTVTLNVAYN